MKNVEMAGPTILEMVGRYDKARGRWVPFFKLKVGTLGPILFQGNVSFESEEQCREFAEFVGTLLEGAIPDPDGASYNS